MTPRAHKLGLLFAGVLALPTVTLAETVADTAADWGLVGVWALDCRLPPSQGNAYQAYVVASGGRLVHERDFGLRQDAGDVLRATLAVGGIDLLVYFPASAQTRLITLAKSPDGRLRILSDSFTSTNEYAVRDGKFAGTGIDTPWQMRCR
jgi:hypothetical protein